MLINRISKNDAKYYSLKNFNLQIKMVPTKAGNAKLISHKITDVVKTTDVS